MTRVHDPNILASKKSYPKGRYCIVEIIFKNKRKQSCRVDIPHGSPDLPLNINDLYKKAENLLPKNNKELIALFSKNETVNIKDIIQFI